MWDRNRAIGYSMDVSQQVQGPLDLRTAQSHPLRIRFFGEEAGLRIVTLELGSNSHRWLCIRTHTDLYNVINLFVCCALVDY